ncbi:MAG TPA: GIY-YIG nuclease family protein [Thermoanaerobaculia bacterium]
MRGAYVYIMSNKSHRIYVGSTTNLPTRVAEHRMKRYPSGFTARYKFDRLVWFDAAAAFDAALLREKQIKGWTRAKKVALIQENNADWRDLSASWTELLRIE